VSMTLGFVATTAFALGFLVGLIVAEWLSS
jgi:hypothetical protein